MPNLGSKVILVWRPEATSGAEPGDEAFEDPFDGIEVFAVVHGDAAADMIADKLVEDNPGWKVMVC